MNGWDVLNTFLSVSATGTIAYAIALSFKKLEAKRAQGDRRQNALEKLCDAFEKISSSTASLAGLFWSFAEACETLGPDAARQTYSAEFRTEIDSYQGTIGDLSMLIGRAEMLGLRDISQTFQRMSDVRKQIVECIEFKQQPQNAQVEKVRKLCAEVEAERGRFHAQIRSAFTDLG